MFTPLLLLSVLLHPPALVAWPEVPPPISDLSRLPSAEMVDGQLAFLDARRHYLNDLRSFQRDSRFAPWFEDAVVDLECRREAWQALQAAQVWASPHKLGEWDATHGYDEDERQWTARHNLARLRRLLGAREYDAGVMPGLCAPEFWRR